MTADMTTSIRASRIRVPRSRGAASGFLLLVLGAWAAIVPFIGPYLNVAYTPAPNKAWHWTSGRGWLEVLPGAVVVLGGVLLLLSRSRLVTSFGGWLAALGGLWLIVGPSLTRVLDVSIGVPDPASRDAVRALAALAFFYGIGAAILFVAALALGRLSVHSVRDVRAAERRAAAEEAAEAEERRRLQERAAAAREEDRAAAGSDAAPANGHGPTPAGRHERPASDANADSTPPPTMQQPPVQQPPVQQQPYGQPPSAQQPYGQQPYGQPPAQPPYTSAPPPPPPER